MSSAALQTAPHQPTSIVSQSPVAAPSSSGRPYTSGSQQSRDPYYNQNVTNASPSSARKPSRRPSGNGASTNTPPQTQYNLPSVTINSVPINSRTTNTTANSSNHTSPTITTAASAFSPMAPGDHQQSVPPVVSERTSSNRPSTAVATGASTANRTSSSRRGEYTNEQRTRDSPRRAQSQEDQHHDRRNIQTNGVGSEDATAATNAANRSKRRAQQLPEAIPHRPGGSREQRAGQSSSGGAQSRSHPAGATSAAAALSHEASEVLNRVMVSDPQVDLDRERERMAEAVSPSAAAPPVVEEAAPRQQRSRHDHSNSGKREKNTKFGEYYLGNTLGEGEFGKVKMGWKSEGIQVAIKLIRRDSVGTNSSRLAKIYREISILRQINHPNIVQLHEMVETEKQIGIILEYASGGELFDYILTHRYLKDNAARRLFAQLVSGVGYLHKKGIVHRDLKLENLLLDRNRNIIITDFGFANTFNPDDELGDEIEYNLASRDYVKRMELDKLLPDGTRRGDLMQTSCGSPCYAAPELVVSDSLYTGRKVDVWSCGVILYAMLAGYLPFDDDPANPEGDNINLLYKYIVSTPLTFPEYVTPHARDLLRRILVPDPRKRADLFEVARHSWLSEYAHVVGFITSSTTTTVEIANTTVPSPDEPHDTPQLARSASVREPKSQKVPAAVGDLSRKHGHVDQDGEEAPGKTSKDNKRRTVQVEYVAPRSQTQRGEPATNSGSAQSGSRTRARTGSQGPVEISGAQQGWRKNVPAGDKPLPQDPPVTRDAQYATSGRRPESSQRQQGMPPPSRTTREHRAASEINHVSPVTGQPSIARPNTGGSMTSNRSGSMGFPTRGSYSQPVAPTVAGTNAHGRMSQPQPKSSRSYNISPPMMQGEQTFEHPTQPTSQPIAPKFARVAGLPEGAANTPSEGSKTHKRSNTIGGIFSRTNSLFGGKSHSDKPSDKPKKSYPPVSMSNANITNADDSRQSMDSRRSISFGFGKKRSGSITGRSQTGSQEKASRRFSLLPASFSLKSIGIGKEAGTPPASTPTDGHYEPYSELQGNHLDAPQDNSDARNVSGSTADYQHADGSHDRNRASPAQLERQRFAPPQQQTQEPGSGVPSQFLPPINFRQDESALTTDSESSLGQNRRGPYQNENNTSYEDSRRPIGRNSGRGVLQKNNRKFADAYDQDYAHNDHGGSSGAARKVMDFFRRRGKARGE